MLKDCLTIFAVVKKNKPIKIPKNIVANSRPFESDELPIA